MKKYSSETLGTIALAAVILLPVLGGISYVLYQQGYFHSAPQASVPTTPAPAAPAPAPQSAAQITLNAPDKLPTAVAQGEMADFSFTVRNPGTAAATYPYKVTVKWSTGEENVIDINELSLAAGQSKTINESLKFERANETGQITIATQNPANSIQFTLPRRNG